MLEPERLRSLRSAGIALVAIFTILLLVLGAVGTLTIPQRSRARAFLQELTRLKLVESTFEDAQRLAEDYGGKPSNLSSQNADCSAESCEFLFTFDNKPLRYLPGIPGVYFGAAITVKKGHVVESTMIYQRLANSGEPSPEVGDPKYEHLYGVRDIVNQVKYGVTKKELDAQGIPHFLYVSLGPRSSAEARKSAYSLDLSCRARLNGCDSASAIYPLGWETW